MNPPSHHKNGYCNWTFWECLKPKTTWRMHRDCEEMGSDDHGTNFTLTRGDSRNWKAYEASLEPRDVGHPKTDRSRCPNCQKYINGVNPHDDGETWRKS